LQSKVFVLKGALAALRVAAQEKHPEMVRVIRRFKVDSNADAVTLTGSVPATFVNAFVTNLSRTIRGSPFARLTS
jgi:hypothetical protein